MVLSLEAGQVVGRAGVGGAIVFTVTTDASGNVTLDQQRAVVHPTANANEPVSLNADNLVTLTATITDKDGDSSAATLNIGQNLTFLDDGPAFTLVNDGNGDGIVSLSALNPATATTYPGQFAEWQYGADGFGSVTATGPNVEVASTSASQIVLNLKEGDEIVAKLTLNADGTDSLEVLHRASDIQFTDVGSALAQAGGPVGSKLVDLGAATDFNIVITGSDGDATPNEPADAVNTNNGWAVDNGNIESNESLLFSFVNESNSSIPHSVGDFKFQTEGYAGGLSTAHITIRVYLDASMTTYDTVSINTTSGQVIQISQLNWSAVTGTGNYVPGDDIYGVKVISDASNGGGKFRLDGVKVGAESVTPPADLDFNGIKVTITDHDGDTASQTFNVHIAGTTGDQLTVEAIAGTSENDNLAGTASSDSLVGGAGNDIINGLAGADTLTGGIGADTLTGGAGADRFVIAAGDSTPTVGGSGNSGTIAGHDIITDWGAGGTADKLDFSVGPVLALATVGVDGNDSTLTFSNATIKSHAISANGIITFDDANTYTSALTLNTPGGVAAAVQYLMANDLGNAGTTVAFVGNGNTYVYEQTTTNAGGTLVELTGITNITNLNTLITNGAVDPIILDLNHDGFAFSDLNHGVQFDINGDGTKDQVAWNSSNDGMLAVDLNHDGTIDDGTELFTPNFGGGNFASGAAALASLDSNHDGVIDHDDAAFSSLLIWKDANANGTSDAGELSHLADNGIVSISTAATPTVGEIDGQTVTGNGTFEMADGTTGNYVEVELDTSLVAPAPSPVASDGSQTFAIGSLDTADLIADFHDGANGDKIDLSALLKGLAGVVDLEAGGFVEIAQSSANAANAEVKVDTDGGGDNYQTVAVLENYTFHSAAEAVKILYDDSHGTKTDVA
ncbi:MAG: type I secretion C-terminal target domain-containing protein [Mesorhizobium sp.]|nr:MAG: type I secretion C-terminal target domain-containing protein [Mesorhizobium sp.]